MFLTARIQNIFKQHLTERRNKKIFRNVVNMFLVKILSTIVTLSLIPVSLGYTDAATYGVWLTLSSFITSVQILDFGLSNGLANRLAIAFTNNDLKLAKSYISTTYSFMVIIASSLATVFLLSASYINWQHLFNTKIKAEELLITVKVCFLILCITFLLKPINDLLQAKQKHFVISIMQVSANLAALTIIYFFGKYFENKFLFLGITLAGTYPFALGISSIYLYLNNFKSVRPKINLTEFPHLRTIFGISIKFFIINAAIIGVSSSNNLLIGYYVNTESVTYYTLAYRLFSIVLIFQAMIINPLWPAYTEAFTLKDFGWIRRTIGNINRINTVLSAGVICLLLLSPTIYEVWIGKTLQIPMSMNVMMTLFIIISLYKENYVSFLNGAGKLNLQVIFSVFTLILQFPFAFLFVRIFDMGVQGILLLNIIWVLVGGVIWKFQYTRLIIPDASQIKTGSNALIHTEQV